MTLTSVVTYSWWDTPFRGHVTTGPKFWMHHGFMTCHKTPICSGSCSRCLVTGGHPFGWNDSPLSPMGVFLGDAVERQVKNVTASYKCGWSPCRKGVHLQNVSPAAVRDAHEINGLTIWPSLMALISCVSFSHSTRLQIDLPTALNDKVQKIPLHWNTYQESKI